MHKDGWLCDIEMGKAILVLFVSSLINYKFIRYFKAETMERQDSMMSEAEEKERI